MQRSITRGLGTTVALVTAAAWLLAANHCTVACLLPQSASATSEHEHCGAPDAPADGDQPTGCDSLNCCKSLSAPATFAKKLVGYDKASYTPTHYVATEFTFPSDQHDAPLSQLDTGPPGLPSFAESVLQRSLLAHAPPFLS